MRPNYTASKQQQLAFTLVEMMVTVSIVGILAGVSIVAFTRNWRDERVKSATQESSAWLDEIRRIAIQRAAPCVVELNQATAAFSLIEQAGSCNQPAAPGVPSDDVAGFTPRTSIQAAQNLIICGTVLAGPDPATIALPCSTAQTGSIQTTFTPRGTVTKGLLLKFHMDEANTDRCIAVIAPLGQIRPGRANANGTCNFETAF